MAIYTIKAIHRWQSTQINLFIDLYLLPTPINQNYLSAFYASTKLWSIYTSFTMGVSMACGIFQINICKQWQWQWMLWSYTFKIKSGRTFFRRKGVLADDKDDSNVAQVEKVFYQMLKKMINMLLLLVKTTLTKLFCVLKAYSSRSDSKGVLWDVKEDDSNVTLACDDGQVWEVLESW